MQRALSIAAVMTAMAVVLSVGALQLIAQSPPQATGNVPRAPDGKPDFSGFWEHPQRPGTSYGGTVFDLSKMAPFQPGGEALFYEPRTGVPIHDEPRSFCMPSGFPSNLFRRHPVQIVQTPKWLVMVHEYDRMTRLIPLDGREHRPDIEPTYYGDPVGRWDGDTLVIESRNFKRWSLDDYYYQDPTKYRMHSEELRTIERLQLTDGGKMITYQITIDDPKIFTKPWSENLVMRVRPDWEKVGMYEFVCLENNRCVGGKCSN